jgi:copper oxidase (laccase) domain-containing protein
MDPVTIKVIDDTVRLGYAGKRLGNTQIGYGPEAKANFDRFTAKFPGKKIYDMPAVGKDSIIGVDRLTPEELWRAEADALITGNPGNLLALKAADCIPLIFYVPAERRLALAHVGTSGAALHLPAKIVKELDFPSDRIKVYVGPHISQKSYRFIDKDLSDKKLDDSWNSYITHETDGIHLNLLGYVLDELKRVGIRQENIEIDEIDTGADPDYFSHRRHKLTGEPNGRNCFAAHLL